MPSFVSRQAEMCSSGLPAGLRRSHNGTMLRVLTLWSAASLTLLEASAVHGQHVAVARGRPIPVDLSGEVAPVSWDARAWTMDDGLPQNSVTSLAQTPDGFLWIGTYGGLVRFDGVRFTVYEITSTPELGSNRVYALCTDREGRLWIRAQGLIVYEQGAFRRLDSELVPTRSVRSLVEDSHGTLWAAGRGVARFTGERFVLHAHETIGNVRNLIGLDGELWAAGFESTSLVALDAERDPCTPEELIGRALSTHPPRESWNDGEAIRNFPAVDDIIRDRTDNVWVAAANTLALAVPDAGTESTKVTAWRPRRVLDTEGAPIQCLFEDREGNIWVGTSGEGLFRLRRRYFAGIGADQGLPVRPPNLLAQRSSGGWWLARTSGSPWIWIFDDGESEQPLRSKSGSGPDDGIQCLLEDSEGALWVSHSGRLARYGDALLHSIDLEFGVFSLLEDRDGAIWGGARDALVRIEGESVREFDLRELGLGKILALSEAPDGALWIGGARGVGRLRNGVPEGFGAAEGAPHSVVRTIHHDAHGGTWLGSYGGGLTRFKDGVFTACTVRDGLPDNAICNIQADGRGSLWVNSNRGVFRVEESTLVAFADGKASRIHATLLGTPEGDGRSGATAVDGRMCFPTISGLVVIDPARIDAAPRPLPVVIERLATPATEFDASSLAALPPLARGERDLHLDFSSPRLTDPLDTRYRFRLDGYDDAWIEDSSGRASFRRLPPGRYRFEVVALDGSGRESVAPTTLDIEVPAYFHETRWFVVICVLTLSALALTAHRLRAGRLESQREQLENVISALDANIAVIDGAGLISSVNESWRRFASDNGNAVETPGPGDDYLDVCRRSGAGESLEGIQDVLSGARSRFEIEYECPAPSGPRWFVMYVTPLAGGGAVVAHVDVSAVKRAEIELRTLATQLNVAEEDERRRIARELHDDFSQRLAAVAIDIAAATKGQPHGEQLQGLNVRIRALAEDMHDLSRRLHPAILDDLGLVRAVESECHDFLKRTGIDVTCDVDGDQAPPDHNTSLSCYRILQECLRNVEKHARATWVRVELRLDEDLLTLSVRDNGRGFTDADSGASFGLGLRSMRERVTTLGGRLSVSSRSGEGTRIEARLPLHEKANRERRPGYPG